MSYYQYYEVMKNMQPFDKIKIRFEMVKHAKKESIADAAHIFNTSRPTVYKWLKRYDKKGIEGLYNRSRAPRRVQNKTPKHIEDIVVAKRAMNRVKCRPRCWLEILEFLYLMKLQGKFFMKEKTI